ncbi:MAG: hypothetical protein VB111_05840 [Clostridiaceae bacterium]|nr:hypothetical protein [Clostridiaceae bacterium]
MSFSYKRALSITAAKRRITKATGIPTTRSGRQRKIGRAVTGGGCLLPVIGAALLVAAAFTFLIVLI